MILKFNKLLIMQKLVIAILIEDYTEIFQDNKKINKYIINPWLHTKIFFKKILFITTLIVLNK